MKFSLKKATEKIKIFFKDFRREAAKKLRDFLKDFSPRSGEKKIKDFPKP